MTDESPAEKAVWALHRTHSSARPDFREGWNAAIAACATAVRNALSLDDPQPPFKPRSYDELIAINRAWLDADCQKWGAFEKALDAMISPEERT